LPAGNIDEFISFAQLAISYKLCVQMSTRVWYVPKPMKLVIGYGFKTNQKAS